jgi:hypothetical protein
MQTKSEKGFFDWKEIGVFVLGPDDIYIYDDIGEEEKADMIKKVREYFWGKEKYD